MMAGTERGKKVRLYYLDCERLTVTIMRVLIRYKQKHTAPFGAKRGQDQMTTKIDVANQIEKIFAAEGWTGAQVWVGGSVVRVYLGKGFVQIGKFDLDCRKLNHHAAYNLIRTLSYTIDDIPLAAPQPEWQQKGYTSQLDFDMEDPNGMYYG